ncbi:MAG: pyrroline-5-carboxylate reductase [Limnochordales bacterium]|nr:pyrroline-5-carboxylate reductase [Limnochordales bacterium]
MAAAETEPAKTLACIGVGAMGEALVRGLLRAGLVARDALWIADADEARRARVAQEHGVQAGSNAEAAAAADTVIVAVKPPDVPPVLREIGSVLRPGACVISIAAGVPLRVIEGHLPPGTAAVRAMPNTPCLIGQGAIALAPGRHARPEHVAEAQRLFRALGVAVTVDEAHMDAVTGLSGSGPAYVYLFIEGLADGGVKAGLPRDVALLLAAQTVAGAARMVLETGRHPGELKDMVTSPAGTTITGVSVLEDRGLRGAALRAVEAAAARSAELGRLAGQEAAD